MQGKRLAQTYLPTPKKERKENIWKSRNFLKWGGKIKGNTSR